MTIYDRDAAVAYARKYWSRVCSDGFIAQYPTPKGGYRKLDLATMIVHDVGEDGAHSEHAELPDGNVIPWKPLDDCSHFLSCCIGSEPGERGGGLHVPLLEPLGAPSRRPYGIVGAPKLAGWLKALSGVRTIDVAPGEGAKIDEASPGDVIGARIARSGLAGFEHFMLYLGEGKIACHTYSRCDSGGDGWTDEWDNDWNVGEGTWAVGWTLFLMP